MKKLFSVLLIIFFTQLLHAQWVQIPSGTFENLNSIQFPDANTGYAVGNAGVVLKTTNGGQNWLTLSTGSTRKNLGLYFINQSTGFVCGLDNTVLKTTNGGTNWNILRQINGGLTISSIYFLNESTGYITTNEGYYSLEVTTNGGSTWNTFGAFLHPNSLKFLNATFSFLTDYGNSEDDIMVNTGSGYNRYKIYPSSNSGYHLNTVDFLTTTMGYCAGDSGKIFKTNNGGVNWSFQNSNTANSFKSIRATDLNTAIVVGNSGTIKATSNGGATWYSQNSTTANNLNSLSMINATTGFIVGDVGTILKTTTGGVGITRLESNVPDNYSLSQNYPNPFNPSTKIRFDLPKNSFTKLTIYDISGKAIDELVNSELLSGAYEITWDGTNYSSGVYFYRMETNGFVDMKRMVFVK